MGPGVPSRPSGRARSGEPASERSRAGQRIVAHRAIAGTRFGKGIIQQLTDLQFTRIGRTLAEPRRIRILQEIAAYGTSMPSARLLRKYQVTAATLSHHAKELHNSGLVEIVRHGKFVHLVLRRDVWQAYVKRLSDLIDGSGFAFRKAKSRDCRDEESNSYGNSHCTKRKHFPRD